MLWPCYPGKRQSLRGLPGEEETLYQKHILPWGCISAAIRLQIKRCTHKRTRTCADICAPMWIQLGALEKSQQQNGSAANRKELARAPVCSRAGFRPSQMFIRVGCFIGWNVIFVEITLKLFQNQRKISKRKSKKTGQQCRKGRRWLRGLDLILIWISESFWILLLFDVLLYIEMFFGAQQNEQTWQWFNVDVAAGPTFFTDEHYLVFGGLKGCKRLLVGLVVMWKWPFNGM